MVRARKDIKMRVQFKRRLWMATTILASSVIGLGCGVVRLASGDAVPAAAAYGWDIFAGAELLFLAMLNFMTRTAAAAGEPHNRIIEQSAQPVRRP